MDHFQNVYVSQAHEYHQMIAAEDEKGNLRRAIERIINPMKKQILDLGSGTGRFPILLHQVVNQLVAVDLNFPMLVEQKKQRRSVNGQWHLINGNMLALPFPSQSWEGVISGWAIGHLTSWFHGDWQERIDRIIEEMHRVIKKDGVLVICETMGTGCLKPAPPNIDLAHYYERLEHLWGFQTEIIPTDYKFKDVNTAVKHTEFFFGTDMAELIRANHWATLPEWTGIWYKKF